MPNMSAATLDAAKLFLAGLSTDDPTAFERELARKALMLLDSTQGIDFWNATGVQRNAMAGALKDGLKKSDCLKSLADYCVKRNPVSDIAQPFITDEFDRSGWFAYFYYEAVAGYGKASTQSQELMDTITNALFFKRKQSAPRDAWVMPLAFDEIADDLFRAMLFELLVLGFERIPSTRKQAVAGDASDAAIIGRMLWAGDAAQVQGTAIKVVPVEFKWRGDSRPFDAIRRSNGFSTKANSEGYAKAKNLRAAWHPLSDEGLRKYLWFRKGNTDNCLYNVVSVGSNAKDWKTYLPYPLIKMSGGKASGLPGYLGVRKVKCQPVSGGGVVEIDLAVSETYLYLFVFAGLAIDTGAMQGKQAYPEVGVGEIPFKNVYGAVRALRVHLGDPDTVTDDDGVAVALKAHTRTDDDFLSIRASYGETLFAAMKDAFEAVDRTGPVGVKWQASGAGYSDLNPFAQAFTVKGVAYRIAQMPAL